jgi:hypothetical protein
MNKEKFKGFTLGFIVCAMLFAGVMAVSAQTVNRNITYGVGVILNGQQVNFDHDSRPFVMDGRTFLPLRTIAELMDLPVNFDAASNNAILGRAVARRGTPVNELFFDGDSKRISGHSGHIRHHVEIRDEMIMGGNRFNNVVAFFAYNHSMSDNDNTFTQNAMLNLNGRYSWFNGILGREDGTGTNDAIVNIYADDRLIESFEQSAHSLPREFRLFVEGVRNIRVEVTHASGSHISTYALSGFAE